LDTSPRDATPGLRIVGFHVMPLVYRFIADWAARRGHRLILVVTSPGRIDGPPIEAHYGNTVADLVAAAPPGQDFLVTRRMKTVAAPVIRALAPDLVLSSTFPHRIPQEIVDIPRLGAVNLHPTPLPRGRGSNPARLIYEGDEVVGGTLHRIVPEWDAGPILSVQTRPLPEPLTVEGVLGIMIEAVGTALDEGVQRAIAGEPGVPQDESRATYVTAFTEAEYRLDWREPARTLQRRTLALNFPGGARARGEIDGAWSAVRSVTPVPGASSGAPGTLVERRGDRLIVRAGDGLVEVELGPSPAD
jgi:methionyl-tRNA formyltransferase